MFGLELEVGLVLFLTLNLGPVLVLLEGDGRVDTGSEAPDSFANLKGLLELIRLLIKGGVDDVVVQANGLEARSGHDVGHAGRWGLLSWFW